MPSLHDKTIIIDGLIVSNFGPEIFRAMRTADEAFFVAPNG